MAWNYIQLFFHFSVQFSFIFSLVIPIFVSHALQFVYGYSIAVFFSLLFSLRIIMSIKYKRKLELVSWSSTINIEWHRKVRWGYFLFSIIRFNGCTYHQNKRYTKIRYLCIKRLGWGWMIIVLCFQTEQKLTPTRKNCQ